MYSKNDGRCRHSDESKITIFGHMRHIILPVGLLACALIASGQNQPPQITNLGVTSDTVNKKLHINFDLSDAESDAVEISVGLSDDGGETFLAAFTNPTGDVGYPITPGSGKSIEISYDAGISFIGNYQVRVVADDRIVPDIADLVAQVDSVRLFNDLSYVASGPRHYQGGTAHLEAVKDFIENRFDSAGLQAYRQPFTVEGYSAHNIIGRLPGLKNEGATIIIDGHFDTVENSPGADDNGSAVVGMLEAMRVLSQYQFEHSVKFIGFDFEETTTVIGLHGSRNYVDSGGIKPYEDIEGVFNLEMIGYYSEEPNSQSMPTGFNILFPSQSAELQADSYRGNFVTNVADYNSRFLMAVYDSMATQYVPQLKVVSIGIPQGIVLFDLLRSDHASFWGSGYPALMLTDGANFRNHDYHTPDDTVGSMNFTFMSNIVKATVASVAEVAKLQHSSYAVKQVDGPVQVREIGAECEMHVTAGPQGSYLNLSSTCETTSWSTLQLYSAGGRLTGTFSMEPGITQVRLPGNLAPGIYIAVVRGKQYHAAKRFVVIE